MARLGRKSWTERCPAELVRSAAERIRSGESAQSVYTDLELQKHCSLRTFRRLAKAVRLSMREAAGGGGEAPSDAVIEADVRRELHRQLRAGTARASFLAQCRHMLEALRRPKPTEEGAE